MRVCVQPVSHALRFVCRNCIVCTTTVDPLAAAYLAPKPPYQGASDLVYSDKAAMKLAALTALTVCSLEGILQLFPESAASVACGESKPGQQTMLAVLVKPSREYEQLVGGRF